MASPTGHILKTPTGSGDFRRLCLVRGESCSRTVARTSGAFYGTPQLSPDGGRLAVAEAPVAGGEEQRIVVFDVRTGHRLATVGRGHHDESPSWSPSGSEIAFDRDAQVIDNVLRGQLIVASASGGRSHPVGAGVQPTWGR